MSLILLESSIFLNVICNISRNTDHWSYINIFIKFQFNFFNLFYQFINIFGRFLHVFNTFYIFYPAVLPEVQQRGSHAKGRWLQRLAHNIPVVEESLLIHTLQKRARRDNFHYLFERNLHFVFLPSRTLEILQLATETSVIMKTKLKFAEDIDVRPCAELRTSPSAANLFARSTWIRDNFLTKLSFLYIGFVLMKNLKMEFSSIMD